MVFYYQHRWDSSGSEGEGQRPNIFSTCRDSTACDDVDNGLDNTCEVIRQETVVFSTPETDYII